MTSIITIVDAEGHRMVTVSPTMAHRMEADFQVSATTDPAVRRFMSMTERAAARRQVVRAHTGIAHPHDHAGDSDFVPGGAFDAFVASAGADVFV